MAANHILNRLNSGDQEKVYGFEPLTEGEIRLAELEKGSRNAAHPISCRLIRTDLTSEPFVAISYCWGDTRDVVPLSINGVSYRVTRPVATILGLLTASPIQLQETSAHNPANLLGKHLIWIDAICINQEDIEERQAQMSMMKEVYASASRTMIYLGQPPSGNLSAKAALDWLLGLTTEPMQQFLKTAKEVRLCRWNAASWRLVSELLEQAWFRRRWTVQEAVASRDIWVVYGHEILQWDRFADGIERCAYLWDDLAQNPGFQLQITEPLADPSPTISIARLKARSAKGTTLPSLLEILLRFRRCGCMYAEERIFALQGLCNEVERKANRPSLNLGPTRAFKGFVLSYIRLYENLDVLCTCLEIARFERQTVQTLQDGLWVRPDDPRWAKMQFLPDLPTWVPNFSSYRVEWLLGPAIDLYRPEFRPLFKASHGCTRTMPDLREAELTGVLLVEGIEIDSIAQFHPEAPVSSEVYQTRSSSFWESSWAWTSSGSSVPYAYPTQDARWMAYLRTIGAGSRSQGEDVILSDEYVRYHGMNFFAGTRLAQQWQGSGLKAQLPRNASDWYLPRQPDADHEYLPGISFDKLCYFRFIRGTSGRIGLAPPRTGPGDKIVVVFGCSSPLLLVEDINRSGHYRIRGEVYMDGFMFGEAVGLWGQKRLSKKKLRLI